MGRGFQSGDQEPPRIRSPILALLCLGVAVLTWTDLVEPELRRARRESRVLETGARVEGRVSGKRRVPYSCGQMTCYHNQVKIEYEATTQTRSAWLTVRNAAAPHPAWKRIEIGQTFDVFFHEDGGSAVVPALMEFKGAQWGGVVIYGLLMLGLAVLAGFLVTPRIGVPPKAAE